MVIASLLSLMLVQEPTVTLTANCRQLGEVVAKLSESSSKPLKVALPLQGKVVLLHVKDAPLEETLQRLAQVSTAEWRDEPDGSRLLYRSEQLIRKVEQEEFESRLAEVKRQQGYCRAKLASLGAYDPKAYVDRLWQITTSGGDPYEFREAGAPEHRLALELFVSADPNAIAAGMSFGHVGFAFDPASGEHNYGREARQAVDAYAEYQRIVAERWKSRWEQTTDHSRRHVIEDPVAFKPVEALLTVQRTYGSGMLSGELYLADEEGRVRRRGNVWQVEAEELLMAQAPSADHFVDASIETKAISDHRAQKVRHLDPQVRSKMVSPQDHDPLSFVIGDLFVRFAELRQMNCVAVVPDRLYTIAYRLPTVQVRQSQFQSWLRLFQMNWEEGSGWIQVETRAPLESELHNYSRQAFAEYVESCERDAGPTLEAAAKLACSIAPTGYSSLDRFFGGSLWTYGFSSYGMDGWEFLKVFGSLSPAASAALVSGTPIRCSSLTKAQQNALLRAVTSDAPWGITSSSEQPMHLDDCPTRVDIGKDAVLSCSYSEAPFYWAENSQSLDGSGRPEPMNIDSLGRLLAGLEQPGSRPVPDRFLPAKAKVWRFRIDLDGTRSSTFTMEQRNLAHGALLSLKDLPPQSRKEIEGAIERAKKWFGGGGGGEDGR